MLPLFEQYGYYEERRCIQVIDDKHIRILKSKPLHNRNVKRKNKDHFCYQIDWSEHDGKPEFYFQSSYFIGVDWIVENELSIYLQPKLNRILPEKTEIVEIDYIRMLLDALQEHENFDHLDELCEIDFNKPYISITQKQDLLSPFLIAQFLQLLKQIVRKGLKKSYYTVSENLNAKVKGKVLIIKDIKENKAKGSLIQTRCQFQEFGTNCDENKILKKAYSFSRRVIQQYEKGMDTKSLQRIIDYIHPVFETISEDIDISKIKSFNPNPIFKEYNQALKLARLILKRFSYNITLTEQETIATPPFWIDMSKLFELYVFKKLRKLIPTQSEVIYHYTSRSKELDFLINSQNRNIQMVVDTKYKPRYRDQSIELADIRQLSAYARLESVYKQLNIPNNIIIDCLIIYPQTEIDAFAIDNFKINKVFEYANFYKLGIQLPMAQNNDKKNETI